MLLIGLKLSAKRLEKCPPAKEQNLLSELQPATYLVIASELTVRVRQEQHFELDITTCFDMRESQLKTMAAALMLLTIQSNAFQPVLTRSTKRRSYRTWPLLHMKMNGQPGEYRKRGHADLNLHDTKDKHITMTASVERYTYLRSATLRLLDTDSFPPVKGKWHELNSMLVAWSKWLNSDTQPRMDDPTEVPLLTESILKLIIDEQAAGNSDVQVTARMYNTILEAWLASVSIPRKRQYSDSGGTGTMQVSVAERALDILKRMQMEYESKGDEYLKPNFFSFLTVLKIWTKTCTATSIPTSQKDVPFHIGSRKSHQTLQWMEYLARSGRNDNAKPNVLTYTIVMDAFAKSGEKDSGSKAEALLRHMEGENIKRNLFCYNLVINAYTRQGRRGGAVDNAERILHELENIYDETADPTMKPDVVTYTSVITAWANSNRRGFGANRAEEILNRMIKAGCEPNTVTFNAVLKTWCRSGETNASDRALDILKQMEEEYCNRNEIVKPDRITYNTLIHTLAKSGKVVDMRNAERILTQMESDSDPKVRPNLFSYNSIIEGWSKVRDGDGAFNAYTVLQKLLLAEKGGRDIHPDSFSFNNVIFALSRSKTESSAIRAEELLQYMETEYACGNTRLRPDVFGYSAAIHAWAGTGDSNAGLRAEKLLRHLEIRSAAGDKKLKPNSGEN